MLRRIDLYASFVGALGLLTAQAQATTIPGPFVVPFANGGTTLSPEAGAIVGNAAATISVILIGLNVPASDLRIKKRPGFAKITGLVNAKEFEDGKSALALPRAEAVRQRLLALGVSPECIQVEDGTKQDPAFTSNLQNFADPVVAIQWAQGGGCWYAASLP